MHLADTKFKTLKEKGVYNPSSRQEEKITAFESVDKTVFYSIPMKIEVALTA